MKLTPAQRHALAHQDLSIEQAEEHAAETAAMIKEATAIKPRAATVYDRAAPVPAHGRISPAQRHRTMALATAVALAAGGSAIAAARPESGVDATEYDLLRVQLGEHLYQLSQISSVERKIEAKRAMVDAYDAHVLGVLEAAKATGKAVQDEVFVTIMIWRLDIGDFGMALDMAEHVLTYKLDLPERYQRGAATLIAEEVAMPALKQTQLDADFPIDILQRAQDLTDAPEWNVNDIVRAKLQKALGLQYVRLADRLEEAADGPAGAKRAAYARALEHLNRAFTLHEACGVKKERERLTKLLEKAAAESDAQST